MEQLLQRKDLIVFRTDKNLGPAIIERTRYIKLAFRDHLHDAKTYQPLTGNGAENRIALCHRKLERFIEKHFEKTSPGRKFLERSMNVKDPYSHFYLLAKVHKSPLKTRPIVSVSGSLLHGLGLWVDEQLQKIAANLPFIFRSSSDVLDSLRLLEEQGKLIPRKGEKFLLFTCDARSMYTNIDTAHALTVIREFLSNSELIKRVPPSDPAYVNHQAVLDALRILMYHNVFQFGDTFWCQKTGTAMGTPPAPMYATIYFLIHELVVIPLFRQWLLLYGRYIDDGFGIWRIPAGEAPHVSRRRWEEFCTAFNSFGSLQWDFSPLGTKATFLDLDIELFDGSFSTSLFAKKLNLYLYLPSHSSHPPGVLHGLILGTIHRIFRLCSHADDARAQLVLFFRRLRLRGYPPRQLERAFHQALLSHQQATRHRRESSNAPVLPDDGSNRLFLHCHFHPAGIPRSLIQSLASNNLFHPHNKPPLCDLSNHNGHPLGFDRLIVAFHRPRNLGNLLCPRRLDPHALQPSEVTPDFDDVLQGPNPNPSSRSLVANAT